jgi:hypothetical protein
MTKSTDHTHSTEGSLGSHLARLRKAAGLSLRQVEEATGQEVSNAYLSQLENNKISKPSPNILHALGLHNVRRCGRGTAAGQSRDVRY